MRTKRMPGMMALFSTVACLAVVGCGGGGGGGGDDNTVALTPANAEPVASEVLSDSLGATELADFSDGVVVASLEQSSSFGLRGFVQQVLAQVADVVEGHSNVSASAVNEETFFCDNAHGQMTVAANDADNNHMLSEGDSASVTLNNCQNTLLDATINGAMSLTITDVSGDIDNEIPPYGARVQFRYSNFATTDTAGTGTTTLDGDMAIRFSTLNGIVFVLDISGQRLEVTDTSAGGESGSLTNYNIHATENDDTGADTASISGTVNAATIGGKVTFRTTQDFEGIGDGNPHTGTMVISGANQSTITVTALSATQVQLDTDENGDKVSDGTKIVTWDDLDV